MAGPPRWGRRGQGVRAVDVRDGRGLPVRLERRAAGGWRDLPQAAGVAHEAVREPGILGGGLPEPEPRVLFDAHTRSFAALGGIPQRGIYDNMKTAVDKVKKGKGRIVNERFATMCAHYLYDPDF